MTQEILDKPNGKKEKKFAIPKLLAVSQSQPDELKQTLKEIRNTMRGNTIEENSKFSIAKGLQDFDKVPHFTEYRKFDEVLRMNKLEMWIELAPKVFGDTPKTREIINVFKAHRDQHKINMRAYERKGEKAIVDILKMDSGETIEMKGWQKFTGMGK